MSDSDPNELQYRWFPVCGIHDLPPQHVFETDLLGEELAIWRGTSGSANVWKNRCPHRGVRLTIGANLGNELRCAYHGYRFAQTSGRCTSVPAQPERAAPQSLCVKVYPVVERDGLVWTRLKSRKLESEPLSVGGSGMPLYPVVVKAPALVVDALLAEYRFRPSAALADPEHQNERCMTSRIDVYRFRSLATRDELSTEALLSLQPVDALCTVIHGVLTAEVAATQRLATLQHHARRLTALRDRCERQA